MDHGSKQETAKGKNDKRKPGPSGPSDKAGQRAIRRVRSPSRPRTWFPRYYKPKVAGKFNKFGREDHAIHKPGFNNNFNNNNGNNNKNNQGRPQFNKKFFFNRRDRIRQQQQAAAERMRDRGFKENKSAEGNSSCQEHILRSFQPRPAPSRDADKHVQDKQRSGSKSDKSQSRERDHGGSGGSRSREPETEQSTAKRAAARYRAIQKKRKEIDQVYYQECEMFGLVVKMLIAKDPSLEIPIQASLRQNLRDIGARCVEAMEKFIEDYDTRELAQ